jgi:glycosyltransferase involved in cell wall biosynthesis
MDVSKIGPDRVRVVYVVTSSLSVRLLQGHLAYLQRGGFDVTLVSSPGKELDRARMLEGVQTVSVPMSREISLWEDVLSLWKLWRVMRRLRPAITNVGTPKAALLGGIVARACRIPCRYYTLRGLRCETTTGLKRLLLLLTERIACLSAHRVICVSESLRQKAIDLGIVDAHRTLVLGSGSFNGVDGGRFAPTAETLRRAVELRGRLRIPAEAPVVGFVGRLTRDKGIAELAEAYSQLRKRFPELRLLLVGDPEEGDPLHPETHRYIESEPQIIHTGFVQDPALYYHVMDVLAFPTHREGFPNAVIEAHAAGKPVVAARSTGVVDAVIDGVTGILVPIGDAGALTDALERLLEDTNLAATLGSAGRERVRREFKQERMWEALVQEYLRLLRTKGLSIPRQASQNAAPATAASAVVVSP